MDINDYEYKRGSKVYAIEYTGDNSITDIIKKWIKDEPLYDIESGSEYLVIINKDGGFTSQLMVYKGSYVIYDEDNIGRRLTASHPKYLDEKYEELNKH